MAVRVDLFLPVHRLGSCLQIRSGRTSTKVRVNKKEIVKRTYRKTGFLRSFETICRCCSKYADSIPVVLFLGFFTGTVMQRWWAVYAAIPGTGKIITLATFYMKRNNPKVR